MDQKEVIRLCKELGCCDACSLRYIGIKHPNAYGDSKAFIQKYLDTPTVSTTHLEAAKLEVEDAQDDTKTMVIDSKSQEIETIVKSEIKTVVDIKTQEDTKPMAIENDSQEIKIEKSEENGSNDIKTKKNGDKIEADATVTPEGDRNDGITQPPAKRIKFQICVSCLGILQEMTWQQSLEMVKEQLDKKRYDCDTFACALSMPYSTILREKSITLYLQSIMPNYNASSLTSLKEAWKWSFGLRMESYIGFTLISGANAPLLVTVVMEYPDEFTEMNVVKSFAPKNFTTRHQPNNRASVEMSRRVVQTALDLASLDKLGLMDWKPVAAVNTAAHCASVSSVREPVYLAGRYIKLSRTLPQTPWMVAGKRMMESSVQETIFEPIAKLYKMAPEEVEFRMKFMSAGREDVDVRCLGEGRPFAVEIADPRRLLNAEELTQVCEELSSGGKVVVKELVYVTKEDLTSLKKGEETKTKTYQALCIKLSHTKEDQAEGTPEVTERDIANINAFRNTTEEGARISLEQKTPIRVLHRRPLLTRSRRILELEARPVPEQKQLFCVRLVTEAGTYVKEWVHGELGRTVPSLSAALGADADILALDVAAIDLLWPPRATPLLVDSGR